MRKICIVTGTRADWGLLSPIAKALAERADVTLQIIATNMHLSERHGYTVDEIRADGFEPDALVAMSEAGRDGAETAHAMAECMHGMAVALSHLKPDLLVILGDRYEMLAVASTATVMRIPIAHIAGGEVSQGAIDDNMRHAITKLASLHLTATESYRRRVIQMGEQPDRVINTGAIGVYNTLNTELMSKSELESSLGFEIDPDTLLVTYHPATLDDEDQRVRMNALLEALKRVGAPVLFTYPNNDPGSSPLIEMIDQFVADSDGRAHAVPSLGRKRYLSALRCVAAVAGNSSSGIVEVPSAGIPTVDIGVRQQGRLRADSVITCGDSSDEIEIALHKALSPECRASARNTINPYSQPDTLRLIVDSLVGTPVKSLRKKTFHDL